MYGMMPSAKIGEARQRAAREHVEHAEDAALLALEQVGEHVRVDARAPGCARRCGTRPARRAGTAGAASGRRSARPCRRWEVRSPSGLRFTLFGFGFFFSFFGFLPGASGFGDDLDAAAGRLDRRARPWTPTSPLSAASSSSLPDRMTFAPSALRDTMPAALQRGEVDVGHLHVSQLAGRTSAMSSRVGELKPRLGRRRCSGIWPPSKPSLWKPPERAFWPLWPRPAVLPQPEPTPRPTR